MTRPPKPAAPSYARPCACDSPIPYRDPGEAASCAKCGHWLEPSVGESLSDSDLPNRRRRRPRRRRKPQPVTAPMRADPDFSWPFEEQNR